MRWIADHFLEGFEVVLDLLPVPKSKVVAVLLGLGSLIADIFVGGLIVLKLAAGQRPLVLMGLFLFFLICGIQYLRIFIDLNTHKRLPGRHRKL